MKDKYQGFDLWVNVLLCMSLRIFPLSGTIVFIHLTSVFGIFHEMLPPFLLALPISSLKFPQDSSIPFVANNFFNG